VARVSESTKVVERVSARPSRALLEIANLKKVFERPPAPPVTAFEDVNLTVGNGEFMTIIGPSGCGKTTLLNCIAGLDLPTSGVLLVDGVATTGPADDRAVVFQQASLFPWRSVEQNIAFGLKLRRKYKRKEIAERVSEMLELVGLTRFRHHFPHEISGGMQQRANLARALAVHPKLVLMDEPFAALDALTKERMQDELAGLASRLGQTVVFITHDIAEAVFLADRVVVMSSGPGRFVREFAIPFERPRVRDLATTEATTEIVAELRELLHPAVGTHEED
jgi:ABC-type nitrate/sulfonate/bicarbonate transport system ATPase subunit